MGYGMKYTKGGFPFHTEGHVDLTKKSGFGPRADKGSDDQSKQLAKSKYEMGKYKIDPTETDAETERREDAAGVGTGSNKKVMKDGAKNKTVQQKSSGVPYTTGKKSFNFNKTNDYNVDRYGPSAGETKAMNKFNFNKSNDYSQKGIDHRKYSNLEKHDDDR